VLDAAPVWLNRIARGFATDPDSATIRGVDFIVWGALVVLGLVLSLDPPAAIGALIVLTGCGLATLSPIGATAALISAVPYVFQLFHFGGNEFSPVEISLFVGGFGLAVRLLLFLFCAHLEDVVSIFSPFTHTAIAGALVIVGALSLTWVADPHHMDESVRSFRTVIFEPIVALFLIRWSVRRGGKTLLVVSFFATGTVVAIDAIVQILRTSGGVSADDIERARGPYPHPNNLAFYLERVLAFTFGLWLATPVKRRWQLLPIVLIAAGLVLTFSRGAMLGAAIGLATLIYILRPRFAWRLYGIGLAVAVVVFALVARARFFATGSSGKESTRELIWKSSLKMLNDHRLTGVGLDQFLYQYGRRYIEPAGWPERYTSHPHNLVLDVWLNLGILGLAVFAWLAVEVVRAIQRLRSTRGIGNAVAVAAAGALVAGAAHGMVDNFFFLPDLATLTWIFFAFLEPSAPGNTASTVSSERA
jgi:putative inorganic carbon (hco3(-)) transporter